MCDTTIAALGAVSHHSAAWLCWHASCPGCLRLVQRRSRQQTMGWDLGPLQSNRCFAARQTGHNTPASPAESATVGVPRTGEGPYCAWDGGVHCSTPLHAATCESDASRLRHSACQLLQRSEITGLRTAGVTRYDDHAVTIRTLSPPDSARRGAVAVPPCAAAMSAAIRVMACHGTARSGQTQHV